MAPTVRVFASFFVAVVWVLSVASPVLADDKSKDEAIELYAKGRDLISEKKPGEALPLLERSLTLLKSPNTELLIAHALKGTGKKARAAEYYRRARINAEAEAAAGQTKYAQTVTEAKRFEEELMKELAVVDVAVPDNGSVTVERTGDEPVVLEKSAQVIVAPGEVRARLSLGESTQEKTVNVAAQGVASISFDAPTKTKPDGTQPPPPPPTEPGGSPFGALTIGGAVVGGVGLVGFGLLAGFGASAQSSYDELEACGTSCPELDAASAEALRDDGEQAALIANVSLGVGIGLVAAGATMIVVDALNGPESVSTEATIQPAVSVSDEGFYAGVVGAF
ncbi:MAG: hypothetical protein HOW73_12700 [Polyangiaceae bacterium]|nr:hypothetical protein [Polyangiaceae bacterium]